MPIPNIESDAGPVDLGPELDLDDISRIDEPPRRRGGRAAIRSRGGETHRPRETSPPQDLGPERPGAARPSLANSMRNGGDRRCPIGRPTPSAGDQQVPSSRLVSATETDLRLMIEQANQATFPAARGNDRPTNRRSAPIFSRWQEIGRNAISSLCSKVNSTVARPTSRMRKTRFPQPT